MATFAELGLSQPLLDALTHLGYEQPTPIQEQAIPELLAGRDVIGQAQTGTGKTAAFGLPLLQYVDPGADEVQSLVLTPTRELCIQVTQALRAYGERRNVDVVAVFGGAPIRNQVAQLKQGAQVVVGTVGRVMDLMSRHALVLSDARFVVLDEADEMLDLGFFEDVETILSRCPSGRQTALFSATIPPEIKRLAEQGMYDPIMIKVRSATLTIDTVDQFFVEVPDREKADALARVLKAERPDQAIIFVRTKIGADRLARALGDRGLRVRALHGDMTQGSRDGVMLAFKGGRERLLVATDIAARGLDISGVSHVVNYDMPNSPEVYVHRIGRTGRVGRSGRAITLITPRQRRELEAVRRHANTEIVEWSGNGGPPERARPDAGGDGGGGGASRRGRRSRSDDGPRSAPRVSEDDTAPQAQTADAEAQAPDAELGVEAQAPDAEVGVEAQAPDAEVGVEAQDAEVGVEAQAPDAEVGVDRDGRGETRRPRHTKPRAREAARAKLIVGAGRNDGIEPADLIGAIVDHTRLDGEDVSHVRVLERFSFVEVPAARAAEVVEKLSGRRLRRTPLRLEVATR